MVRMDRLILTSCYLKITIIHPPPLSSEGLLGCPDCQRLLVRPSTYSAVSDVIKLLDCAPETDAESLDGEIPNDEKYCI